MIPIILLCLVVSSVKSFERFPGFTDILEMDSAFSHSKNEASKRALSGKYRSAVDANAAYDDHYYYDNYFYYNYYMSDDLFDDDYLSLNADDILTNSTLPGDPLYFNVPGFVYYQFYNNECFTGAPNYQVGYQTGVCIQTGSITSFIVTMASTGSSSLCEDVRIQWFMDDNCQSDFLYSDTLSTFSSCHTLSGTKMKYVGLCSSELSALPLLVNSAVLK
jgi:hypothetical protein